MLITLQTDYFPSVGESTAGSRPWKTSRSKAASPGRSATIHLEEVS
jgi:hypothetical protein